MVEVFQEGIGLFLSFCLGLSLIGLIGISPQMYVPTNNAIMDDVKDLLEEPEGSLRIRIDWNIKGYYDGRNLFLYVLGAQMSEPAELGGYPFAIHEGCTIEWDGRGWKVVG